MKETPQQKYQRLLHEVQELTTEVEKIKVTKLSSPLTALTYVAEEDLTAGGETFPKLLGKGAEVPRFRNICKSTFSAMDR